MGCHPPPVAFVRLPHPRESLSWLHIRSIPQRLICVPTSCRSDHLGWYHGPRGGPSQARCRQGPRLRLLSSSSPSSGFEFSPQNGKKSGRRKGVGSAFLRGREGAVFDILECQESGELAGSATPPRGVADPSCPGSRTQGGRGRSVLFLATGCQFSTHPSYPSPEICVRAERASTVCLIGPLRPTTLSFGSTPTLRSAEHGYL